MTADDTIDKLAAPAPVDDDSADDDLRDDTTAEIDAACQQWVRWCLTRKLYGKPSAPVSLLGRLRSRGTGRSCSGGPDAFASADMLALHTAIASEPRDSIDRQVFEIHYYWQIGPVKTVADHLGISRRHYYRLLHDFRARVWARSREILQVNLQAGDELTSRRNSGGG